MSEQFHTEAQGSPELRTGVAAGGVDEARDAQLKADAEAGVVVEPTATPDAADLNSAADADATKAEAEAATAPVAPTPEEQAELDAMVEYTIKEGDLEKIPEAIRGRDGLQVGSVIKVAKDHPLVTGTEVPATPEGGTPTA